MSSSTTLTALFEKWRQINDHEPSRWDDSIQLFLAESRPSTEILKIRQGRWISTVHELEAFIERENRWPHANSRRPAEFRSTDEDRLANYERLPRGSARTHSWIFLGTVGREVGTTALGVRRLRPARGGAAPRDVRGIRLSGLCLCGEPRSLG